MKNKGIVMGVKGAITVMGVALFVLVALCAKIVVA